MLRHVVRLMLVVGFSLGGSLANFFAQAIIAYRFGTGVKVDAYIFSLGLPAFVSGLLVACISYIAVPQLAKLSDRPDQDRLSSNSMLALVALIASVLILLSLPALVLQPALLLPSRSAIHADGVLRTLIALAWLTAAVQVINGLLIARLNAVGRQIFAAILSLPPGLASIAILIAVPGEGIWIAAAGVLFGTIGVTAIALAVQRESFLWRWPALRSLRDLRVSRSAWLSVVALTCFSSYAVIDTFWAPRAGQGVLSGLGYAQRILIGAGNLVIIGPSAIAVPFLARIAASGDKRAFRWATLKIVLAVALCGGGVAILLSNRSDLIVSVLFQRGAFAPSAVRLVASALKHLAPGMAAMLIGVILMRALFCLPGSYVWSAVIGLGWSALYFSLSGVFLGRQATGLADAYSLAWVITILAASIILWKRSAAIGGAGGARTGEGVSTSLA